MNSRYLIFLALIFIQCAAPKAVISVVENSESIAPAEYNFRSDSKNAAALQWKVNDSIVGYEPNLMFRFLHSGTYEVSLYASQSEKTDIAKRTVYVRAPIKCRVLMRTDLGDMIFELSEDTPRHLNNFVRLVEKGFYNGIAFHRVINGFMIQAGDPDTKRENQTAGDLKEIPHEISGSLLHYKGVLAAARMPDNINPDKASSGSQFYIVQGTEFSKKELELISQEKAIPYSKEQIEKYLERGGAPQLDYEYTVFGKMISGFEIIDKIASVQTGQADRPLEDVRIIEMQIIK